MSIWSQIKNWTGGRIKSLDKMDLIALQELMGEICYQELAIGSAINLISGLISKCDFKVIRANKEIKDNEWYRWNYEPNKNQNSTRFIQKIVSKLHRENECLVIDYQGDLLVADSFEKMDDAILGDAFLSVFVGNDNFGDFESSDVLYWQLNDENVKKTLEVLYSSYGKLLAYSMKAYQRSKGTKGIFSYDSLPVAGSAEEKAFNLLLNEKIKTWLTSDNAALPLGRGQKWESIEQKTYNTDSTRDIRAMVDDYLDFAAIAFSIPPTLLNGTVQETSQAIDQLLTVKIDPFVDMIREEVVRKRIGYSGLKKGDNFIIDTKQIKHVDLLSVSESIDKLIGSGPFSINDVRKVVGENPIDEEWANQHYMTKNYAPIEDVLMGTERMN